MSKRVLRELVEKGHVRGWDDPRLYTLIGIRRRGVPPGAILSFINELGVTTSLSTIQITRFEQSVRRYLETSVPRLMLVLDPVRVVIQDLGDLEGQELVLPFSPKQPEFGSYKLKMTSTVYIDQSDFREVSSKDFFRLSPGQTVGLLQVPHPIKAVSFSKDPATGKVTEIQAVLVKDAPKPKAYIQWVPEGSRKVTVRIHNPLFKSENPMAAEGGFLNDINPDSETVYSEALVNSGFDEVRRRAPWPQAEGEKTQSGPEGVRFQAMRVAYFVSSSIPFHIPAQKLVANILLLHRRWTRIVLKTQLCLTGSWRSRKMPRRKPRAKRSSIMLLFLRRPETRRSMRLETTTRHPDIHDFVTQPTPSLTKASPYR